jgi:hypothetical protein
VQPKTSRDEWQDRVEHWRDSGLSAGAVRGRARDQRRTLKCWGTSSAKRGTARQCRRRPDRRLQKRHSSRFGPNRVGLETDPRTARNSGKLAANVFCRVLLELQT